jgi:putative ABC transport system permease protein
VSLWGLAAKNLRRNTLRSVLTIAGIAVAVLAFLLLRTVLDSWTAASQYADQTRVVTRNKITFIQPLPKRYLDKVAQVPGVREVTFASWFGGKDPRPQFEHEFFAAIACDPKTTLDVYPEMSISSDQKAAWVADRQGMVVGEALAHKLGYKVGDKVKLLSAIYPGDWTFTVDGIYHATRKSLNDSQLFFHWDYLNERLPERQKDNVGWIVSRIGPGLSAADVAKTIDNTFDVEDTQTLSQDEGSFAHSFMAGMSAVLTALNVVSLVILGIMMLILGNTVAMGTRERVSEYGVLRAIGFLPSHVAKLVIGEAVTLGLFGGFAGLAVAVGFINYGLGKWIEQNMGSMFPYFRIEATTAGMGLALAVVLGLVAGLLPAWRSSQLKVVDSLRRIA